MCLIARMNQNGKAINISMNASRLKGVIDFKTGILSPKMRDWSINKSVSNRTIDDVV